MAVTGAIFNSLIYGGIDSADYGIYITGEAVYNAPERAVDLVSVPGRNGAIAIDQGHFENIEIEYPAGCFADDQTAFATAISDFRNAIMSQLGYQRLTDTYHPDEYRMALYTAGIEVSPVRRDNGYAGEFTIKFNAKPQRWLTSGEDPVSVTSGDEITNPTLFEASPLLMVEGYGTISFNGYEVDITNDVFGPLLLVSNAEFPFGNKGLTIDGIKVGSGDAMAVTGISLTADFQLYLNDTISAFTFTRVSGLSPSVSVSIGSNSKTAQVKFNFGNFTFTKGTASTNAYTYDATVALGSGGEILWYSNQIHVDYDGDSSIKVYGTLPENYLSYFYVDGDPTANITQIYVNSTATILGHPLYIDCDLGEAYKVEDGEVIGLNRYIDLGSDLPVLAVGDNAVTFDNTITELKIKPNWWKI